jgi:putative flippase GtrA
MKNSQLLPKLRKLAAFAFAGGIGFLVDIGVLRLMLQTFDITPFTARIPAIIAAMSTTWMINRTLTFGVSGRSLHQEGGRYFAVALIGVTLNYLIYSLILIVAPQGFLPELAAAIAVACVTIYSYLGYSRFVFKNSNKE